MANSSIENIIPAISVSVNAAALTRPVLDDLLEVTVQDDIDAPSMATLTLATWNEDELEFTWVDDSRFDPGGALSVSLGYDDSLLINVFSGEITGVELELEPGSSPKLIVRALDHRHRLLRGTHTRSFQNMKDSDIASQIAQINALSPSVVDSKVKLDYVLQHEQPDLEFLKQRADAIGYEVAVDEKTLFFRPRQLKASPDVTLTSGKDLIDFNARLSARSQVGEIRVRGWDPAQKTAIVAKAKAGQETAMAPAGGLKAADGAFGKAVVSIVGRPLSSQAEADQFALGQLENLALGYIVGDGTCFGQPALRAGSVVEVADAGKRFSGPYYVTQARHTYAPQRGYRTSFTVRRNAI